MQKKIYIETYGCQMNVADSKTVAAIVQNKDYYQTADIETANVIIINTCSVRDNAEQKIWNRLDFIKGLKRRNKNIRVGIIGCMAQRISEKLLEHIAVDFVAGPDNYRNIPELINEKDIDLINQGAILDDKETYSGIQPIIDEEEISGFVSITRGCNNFCSYCIVPYTRGRERSRTFEDIFIEVENLVNSNIKELTLLGQNVNSYLSEKDGLKYDFPKLISQLAESFPDLRIRFTTSHPKDLSNDLIKAIASYKNICNHIHLPVQSGSNKILKSMNRKYTREWYLDRINTIKELIPDCGLSSDIFCGFCGETEQDFNDTLSLMQEVRFDSAFMFKYSERPGTYAAKNLADDVPEEQKVARLNQMIDLQNQISLENNQADIGKTFEVLVEGYSKRSKEQLFGRTQYNKVVVFPKENAKKSDLVIVKVDKVSAATLSGKIVK